MVVEIEQHHAIRASDGSPPHREQARKELQRIYQKRKPELQTVNKKRER
jgi:hypothetical protein